MQNLAYIQKENCRTGITNLQDLSPFIPDGVHVAPLYGRQSGYFHKYAEKDVLQRRFATIVL